MNAFSRSFEPGSYGIPDFGAYAMRDALQAMTNDAAHFFGAAGRMIEDAWHLPYSPMAFFGAAAGSAWRSFKAYPDPGFNITEIETATGSVAVTEIPPAELDGTLGAWMRLTRFAKDTQDNGPAVLVVAPCSGHHASLLRQTVRGLLKAHDVAILGWACASKIAPDAGPLRLDDMIAAILQAIRIHSHAGARPLHVLAVCQPAPLALIAAAVREQAGAPLASLALMGGPIDVAAAPTEVTRYANAKPMAWFERNLIMNVPAGRVGAGRRVYPGFLQLAAFIAMNPERHARSWTDRFFDSAARHSGRVAKHDVFYDDYFSVLDLPAEFYLETLDQVFRRRLVARNRFKFEGCHIDLASLRKTALLTIEGAEDDICAPGQTAAAHDICPNVERRGDILQQGAGHYGLFAGRRWKDEILPAYSAFIAD